MALPVIGKEGLSAEKAQTKNLNEDFKYKN